MRIIRTEFLGEIDHGDRLRLEFLDDACIQVRHTVSVPNGKDLLHRGMITPEADLDDPDLMTRMGMPDVHREEIKRLVSEHRTPNRCAAYERQRERAIAGCGRDEMLRHREQLATADSELAALAPPEDDEDLAAEIRTASKRATAASKRATAAARRASG